MDCVASRFSLTYFLGAVDSTVSLKALTLSIAADSNTMAASVSIAHIFGTVTLFRRDFLNQLPEAVGLVTERCVYLLDSHMSNRGIAPDLQHSHSSNK